MSFEEYSRKKRVKAIGNGAHVTLPKDLIGETVLVKYPADEGDSAE